MSLNPPNSLVAALMATRPDCWLDDLVNDYKIDVTRDGDLVSLKYNQPESSMAEPIVQECRGMVVNTRTQEILAWPYNKFWNYGESLAAQIDWNSAKVLEKLDGSLCTLYYNPDFIGHGGWCVATSGHPTAGGKFGSMDLTFAEAFWQVWDDLGMRLPLVERDSNKCFMFEFCADANRVVVKHDKSRIVFHGARNLTIGTEFPHEWLEVVGIEYNWETVKAYPLTTVEACQAAAEALNPVEHEGFIVVDKQFNRVKIKSPQYVALHHMKGAFSRRRAIELWLNGETSELVAHFPDLADTINQVSTELDQLSCEIFFNTLRVKHTFADNPADRKSYAMAVKDKSWSSIAFKLFNVSHDVLTVTHVKQAMRELPIRTMEGLLS